jgi:hypothetical protein
MTPRNRAGSRHVQQRVRHRIASLPLMLLVPITACDDGHRDSSADPGSQGGSTPLTATMADAAPITVSIDEFPITVLHAESSVSDDAPAIIVRAPNANVQVSAYAGCWEGLCVEAPLMTSLPDVGAVDDHVVITFPAADWQLRATVTSPDGWVSGRGDGSEIPSTASGVWDLDVTHHSGRVAVELWGRAPDNSNSLGYVFTIDAQ